MPGLLIIPLNSPTPSVGTEVVIFVDSANSPHGIWKGKLYGINKKQRYADATTETYDCHALITDERVKAVDPLKYMSNPSVNYQVRTVVTAFDEIMLRGKLEHGRMEEEIKKLRIQRDTLRWAMVSTASDSSVERLIAALKNFTGQ